MKKSRDKVDPWKKAYLKSLRDFNQLYSWEVLPKVEVMGTLRRNMPKPAKRGKAK